MDGANAATATNGVMLTIAGLAARDGVSKPTVSIHVKKLVERHGLSVVRDMQGRIASVNATEYDKLRARFADPSQAQAKKPRHSRMVLPRQPIAPPAPPMPTATPVSASAEEIADGETYDEALRKKTLYEAERKRLDLEETKGRLVDRRLVEEAMTRASELAQQAIGGVIEYADELAAAVGRDGPRGARLLLKTVRDDLRAAIAHAYASEAAALAALAASLGDMDAA